MASIRIGAQLYSVRQHCKTPEDLAESMRKVADIGYSAVQLSGQGPMDPQDIARAAEQAGVEIAATHVKWQRLLDEPDAVIAEHKLWGCRHPAIGGLPVQFTGDGTDIDAWLAELPAVAERLAAAGMDFSYHNHNHELVRVDGRTWLELLYEKAAPEDLKAEIDTYWIQAGGGDPAAYLRACAGREPIVHFKDMVITPQREQRFAPVGEGNLNWPAILDACKAGGVEYAFVEQDQCYEQDPFDALAVSYRNLKKMGLE